MKAGLERPCMIVVLSLVVAAVRALARCFTVLKRAVVRRAEAVDPRPLDQRVRESGEW